MSNPDYLTQLIERASQVAGSDYALAKMIDTTPQNVSMWKHGHKTCPIGDQVLMAQVAGLKPEEWAARAIVARYEGTSKGDKLVRALGKALAATGAAIASSGASAHGICSEAVECFIRCIEMLSFRHREATLRIPNPAKAGFFHAGMV